MANLPERVWTDNELPLMDNPYWNAPEGKMTEENGMVPVGTCRLTYTCMGSGSPVVVLEAGAGTPRNTWERIMPPIARYTHVISYDRAGLGESEPAPRRRTCRNFINDLERVLEHNRIPGPYLLVGSSFGGHIIRYFASQHPGEVVGIVLVDPVHHDQNRLALALLPPPSPDDSFHLKAMRFLLTHGYADDPQVDPEGIDFFVCDDQVRAAGALGDLPLVVLTAGNRTPPTDLPADFIEAYHKMFEGLQVELAKLSTRGRQIIAKHSDHFIHEDEPELVVAVIREMMEQARQGAMLSPGRHGRKAP